MRPVGSRAHAQSVHTLLCCIVVWLWEGGTLWRAKWTRRGQKEPHPSITRVDKGGLHNTKLDVPSQTFLHDARRRAHSKKPPAGELSTAVARNPEGGKIFRIYCQWKVAAVVLVRQRSNLSTKQEREAERHRGREAARREREREREERSPFPLSDAGRFEERTWGDAQTRIFITLNNTQTCVT